MSCMPCGCDMEARPMHLCETHTKWPDWGKKVADVSHIKADICETLGLDGGCVMTAEDLLRLNYPHGHPRFLPLTVKELQLHSDKNHDYAKGGEPLGNFTRVAQILALYPNLKVSDQRVVALVYAMKQLDAVLWGMNSGIEHKVEGANSRLQDISVYVKLVMCMNEDSHQEGK